MKCPNCGKEIKKDYCMFCGYMSNGNRIKNVKSQKVSDLEVYLNDDYDIIYRNSNYLTTFILGPLYFCYRKCVVLGIVLCLVDLLVYAFLIAVLSSIPFLSFFPVIYFMLSIFLTRIIYVTFSNIIYMKICNYKIKLAKRKDPINYLDKLRNKSKKSIVYLISSITLIITCFILYILIYRYVNGTL